MNTQSDPLDRPVTGRGNMLPFLPSPLTLGTVQLGVVYGMANTVGRPSDDAVESILELARTLGVTSIDTARAYGDSEERIGRWLAEFPSPPVDLITKVPKIDFTTQDQCSRFVAESVAASRRALAGNKIALLLAHRGIDLLQAAVLSAVRAAVARGEVGAFGASVYSPDVALRLLDETPIAALQLPMSAADRRFETAGVLARAKAMGVAIFVRSVFLQGALLMDPTRLPAHLTSLAPRLARLRVLAHDCGRSLNDLLLVYVRDTPGVSSCIIGVERADQLGPHRSSIVSPALGQAVKSEIITIFDGIPDEIIDPSRWPKDNR